jgi:RNA polymerase sigma factor (sigma-70 family)
MAAEHELDDLLVAARAGAPWALRRLYEALAPVVAGYLRLQGVREVEDVTSEVFLGVFRGLAGFTGDAAAFRSWVFTIAHHRLVDERRRAGRRPVHEPLEDAVVVPAGDTEDEALAALGGVWVAAALDALTDEQREVVALRVLADVSVEETAAIVGKRPGAVRAIQHRALRRLRAALEQGRVSDPRGS